MARYNVHTYVHTQARAHSRTPTPAIFCGTLPANIRIVLLLMFACPAPRLAGIGAEGQRENRRIHSQAFVIIREIMTRDATRARCIDVEIATAVGDRE